MHWFASCSLRSSVTHTDHVTSRQGNHWALGLLMLCSRLPSSPRGPGRPPPFGFPLLPLRSPVWAHASGGFPPPNQPQGFASCASPLSFIGPRMQNEQPQSPTICAAGCFTHTSSRFLSRSNHFISLKPQHVANSLASGRLFGMPLGGALDPPLASLPPATSFPTHQSIRAQSFPPVTDVLDSLFGSPPLEVGRQEDHTPHGHEANVGSPRPLAAGQPGEEPHHAPASQPRSSSHSSISSSPAPHRTRDLTYHRTSSHLQLLQDDAAAPPMELMRPPTTRHAAVLELAL